MRSLDLDSSVVLIVESYLESLKEMENICKLHCQELILLVRHRIPYYSAQLAKIKFVALSTDSVK